MNLVEKIIKEGKLEDLDFSVVGRNRDRDRERDRDRDNSLMSSGEEQSDVETNFSF